MIHAVILFHSSDAGVAQRLHEALAYMKQDGILQTHSILTIAPGQNIQDTITQQANAAQVSILILSIDTEPDTVLHLIQHHQTGSANLFVVYANYVDDQLITTIQSHNIPIVPLPPITAHANKDAAYQRIVKKIRNHLQAKQPAARNNPNRSKLLILLAARRNTLNRNE